MKDGEAVNLAHAIIDGQVVQANNQVQQIRRHLEIMAESARCWTHTSRAKRPWSRYTLGRIDACPTAGRWQHVVSVPAVWAPRPAADPILGLPGLRVLFEAREAWARQTAC